MIIQKGFSISGTLLVCSRHLPLMLLSVNTSSSPYPPLRSDSRHSTTYWKHSLIYLPSLKNNTDSSRLVSCMILKVFDLILRLHTKTQCKDFVFVTYNGQMHSLMSKYTHILLFLTIVQTESSIPEWHVNLFCPYQRQWQTRAEI